MSATSESLNCLVLQGTKHKGVFDQDNIASDDTALCLSVTVSQLIGDVAKAFPS